MARNYEIVNHRGVNDVGEEARELARSCGAEADSLMDRVLPNIPHEDYRVLVVSAALKLAKARGAKSPNTQDYAKAKTYVDKSLVVRGLGISIPNALPGRVTR